MPDKAGLTTVKRNGIKERYKGVDAPDGLDLAGSLSIFKVYRLTPTHFSISCFPLFSFFPLFLQFYILSARSSPEPKQTETEHEQGRERERKTGVGEWGEAWEAKGVWGRREGETHQSLAGWNISAGFITGLASQCAYFVLFYFVAVLSFLLKNRAEN